MKKTDQDVVFVTGPGHGGPALVGASYLEGSYSEIYPRVSLDEEGMTRLFRQFSAPGGIPSHVSVTTPGSIHEGGELGYALVHAFGAVFDNPDLLAVAVVGDGEAETGPLEGSWKGISFVNPERDGAVLPVFHLNGAKIAGPTVLGRKDPEEVRSLFRGHGYDPIEVEGDDEGIHYRFAEALGKAYARIREIQADARAGRPTPEHNGERPRWPMIILRTPKGWTGPHEVDGVVVEGTWRAHQVPLSGVKTDAAHLEILKDWLASYRPGELFDASGSPTPLVLAANPRGDKRMSMIPAVNAGVQRALKIRGLAEYEVDVPSPGTVRAESTRTLGAMMRDMYVDNPDGFRLFCPDETNSNRLGAVFEASDRCSMERTTDADVAISREGRVMEVLSEHNCHGWLEGYVLTGRNGLFASYEAFGLISASQTIQHGKWLEEAGKLAWRKRIPSLNILLSSTCWRNDHNGFSHQGPGLIDNVLSLRGEVSRVFLPVDANTLAVVARNCFESTNRVNLIVQDKQPQLQYLTLQEAEEHVARGYGIWGLVLQRGPRRRGRRDPRLRGRRRDDGGRRGRRDPAAQAPRTEVPRRQRRQPDEPGASEGRPRRHERHRLHRAVHLHSRRRLRLPRIPGRHSQARPRPPRRRPLPRARLHRAGNDDHPVRHGGPQQGGPLPPRDGRHQQLQAQAEGIGRPQALVPGEARQARGVQGRPSQGHARGRRLALRGSPRLTARLMPDMFPGTSLRPYDAVLLVSFGGPEGPDDVLPFLRRVADGRAIPEARLEEVSRHYLAFGGVSPINARNRALVSALRAELDRRGVDVPIVWGNRNWHPFLDEALLELARRGARRILMLPTSAYACYSGCRQYREDVEKALRRIDWTPPPVVERTRVYFDSPGFLEANAQAIVESFLRLASAGADLDRIDLALVTHSIPLAMERGSGEPDRPETRYTAQHEALARVLVPEVARRLGLRRIRYGLVFCSRSGPPHAPWLEPDVNEYMGRLAASGAQAVCCAPIGFVSDHMEVVYDLDVEAKATADGLGLAYDRAATAGTHPAFVSSLADLMLERAAVARGEALDAPPVSITEIGPWHEECRPGACLEREGDVRVEAGRGRTACTSSGPAA